MRLALTSFKILMVLLLTASCYLPAPITEEQRSMLGSFYRVIEAEGQTKNDLFLKINSWMVDRFKNSDDVIEFSDKDAGVITGKFVEVMAFRLKDGNTFVYNVISTIKIDVKDNRARITLKDPVARQSNAPFAPYEAVSSSELATNVLTVWEALADNLSDFLNTNEDDDW
jgi:hypothetical protein